MKALKRIQYNSPVVLSFAGVALLALLLGYLTKGWTTSYLFCVYRSSMLDPLTYVRAFGHVLGHVGYTHFAGNILMILVIGPALEEKYGSRPLLIAILFTALVSGLVQVILFPNSALLGASGIVFMMIVMSSVGSFDEGRIPLTLILVVLLYLGGEVVNGILNTDNVSQLTHIVGGVCGAVIGYILSKNKKQT